MITRKSVVIAVMACLIGLFGCKKDSPTDSDDSEDPTVRITQPVADASVSGNVEIKAVANDNEGVTEVKFYVGGTLKGTDDTAADSEYTYTWDASGETPGSGHTIQAKAHDAGGNVGESVAITVYIAGGGREHSGTISSDETWYAADNPHLVTGDIEVEATLTLEPGVIVKFYAGTGLRVGYYNPGALVADGTVDSTILFTSNIVPAAAGDWAGIGFEDKTIDGITIADNCVIEYGGGDGYANIYCDDAGPTITNCTIRHGSKYGVYCNDETDFSDFSGNTITSNAEYPLRIGSEYVRVIGPNTLTGNTKDGIEVADGSIVTTGTWLDQGVPYVIASDMEVGGTGNPILTIVSGSTLEFRSDVGIRIGYYNPGALAADGSAGQITFTSAISSPSPGDWGGISFEDKTIDGVTALNDCVIEYGGSDGYGNIYCDDAGPTITNCTIRHSSEYGVYCHDETDFSDFSGNTVTSNAEYAVRVGSEYVRTIGSNTFAGNTKEGVEVMGGPISTSGTWLNHTVPYVIAVDLEVGGTGNPVLTIASGSTLEFRSDVGLRIGYYNPGSLIADGSGGEIAFTSAISSPSPGDWSGIEFEDKTIDGTATIDHCLIEYGGANGYANIYCDDASPTITNSAINHSSHWGIYLHDTAAPTMSGNTFDSNADGDVGP